MANVNIDCLPTDCLINIFQFLPVHEKLKMESVCKKWNEAAKISLSNVTYLALPEMLPFQDNSDNQSKRMNNNFVTKFLKRRGIYLREIRFNLILDLYDFSLAVHALPWNCNNLTILEITDNDRKVNAEHLVLLFRKAVNLTKVDLRLSYMHFYPNLRSDYDL